jgi:hypothetical protein
MFSRVLAEAGDEWLTWGANGSEKPRRDSVRTPVGACANTEGSYMVGATRENNAWRIEPI